MSDVSPRLPLVKPYELLRDPMQGKKEDLWEIDLKHDVKFPVAADTIYVDQDRYIIGYGSNGTMVFQGNTSAYMIYFIVDLKKGHERLFELCLFIEEEYDISQITDMLGIKQLMQRDGKLIKNDQDRKSQQFSEEEYAYWTDLHEKILSR